MKKNLRSLLIAILLLTLTVSFFACKERNPSRSESKGDLALLVVQKAFPEGRDDGKAIETALLSLLENASLEDAEIVASLRALAQEGTEIAPALLDLKEKSYDEERSSAYRAALQAVATAVSPEVAGDVYYAAAIDGKESLPYTLSDCEKIANLILGQDAAFGTELFDALLSGEYNATNEKQANTLLMTFSTSLRKAIGISQEAKTFLYDLIEVKVRSFNPQGETELEQEIINVLAGSKELMLSLLGVLRDGYDVTLTYAAEYFSLADARLLIGLPYEKEERTLYYGYRYDDWSATLITREAYEAQSGNYDEYFSRHTTTRGFTVNGEYVVYSNADVLLADRAYRLQTAARAYDALSDENKASFRAFLHSFFSTISTEEALVAALLDRPILDTNERANATFDELLTALARLDDFRPTDGISDAERADAEAAIDAYERYLHAYLPHVF